MIFWSLISLFSDDFHPWLLSFWKSLANDVNGSHILYNLSVVKHHALLNHWGRVTHICITKLTLIGSDNGLPPHLRQAIIWTNAGILLIGPWGTNFSEILIGIHTFSFKKIHLKCRLGNVSHLFHPQCVNIWTSGSPAIVTGCLIALAFQGWWIFDRDWLLSHCMISK